MSINLVAFIEPFRKAGAETWMKRTAEAANVAALNRLLQTQAAQHVFRAVPSKLLSEQFLFRYAIGGKL
jgi:hypothetical protein